MSEVTYSALDLMAASRLLNLPDELLLMVFKYLPQEDLLVVYWVCKRLHGQIEALLPAVYGPGPIHNENCKTSYSLVKDRLKYRSSYWFDPRFPDSGFSYIYECPNKHIKHEATCWLLQLRTILPQKHENDSWKEAAAMALVALNRRNEAAGYYNSLSSQWSNSHGFRIRLFFTMCRFGPLTYDLINTIDPDELAQSMKFAGMNGDLEIIAYLNYKWNARWEDSVKWLVQSGHHDALKVIHQYHKVDVSNETLVPSIRTALEYGYSDTISFLLDIGLQVDQPPSDSHLSYALRYGTVDILQRMLEKNPSLARNLNIPFLRKDESSYSELVSFLVTKAKIDINAVDRSGNAIIHHAARHKIMPLLLAVLEAQPDINVCNRNSQTAKQIAEEEEWVESYSVFQCYREKRQEIV